MKLPKSNVETYPLNRIGSFKQAKNALADSIRFDGDDLAVCLGDSARLLEDLPDNCVDLIVTDPPYHSTKKSNIYGDSEFADNSEFLDWINLFARHWKRVLKPNGSLYLFCSSEMAPYIYVMLSSEWNMHSTITWTKPNEPGYDGWKQKMKKTALRRWYPHSERIIFASPAQEGNLKKSALGLFLKECRALSGLNSKELTAQIGAFGKVNNGGAVSNWETGRNIPSRDQYSKIAQAFIRTKSIQNMPAYEDVVRAFNIDPKLPFTDTWDFMNVRQYRGKHPAEKPQDMLQHIIQTSSYPGDVVLDCFSGSGSTVVAAVNLGRRVLGMEIEEKWVEYSKSFIKQGLESRMVRLQGSEEQEKSGSFVPDALPLFSSS